MREPARRSSLQFSLQLWLQPLLTELCESQQMSATTNKSRHSRLAPHYSPSLPQFLRLQVFSPLPFLNFSFLHKQQKLETASFEVLFALGSSCALSYEEEHW